MVVISENMRRTYIENRKVPADRIATIPTWQDDFIFGQVQDRINACRRYDIPNIYFTFLYLGNIGPVAGVDFLIRAFHEASIDSAQLVIIGDGSAKANCIKLVASLKTERIHFISDPDADNVPLLQSIAHVCLLPMKSGSGKSSIPSKLPAYLFSAKPVLATVDPDSDTARLINEAKCGWVGAPENIEWLTNKMREVITFSDVKLAAFGLNGQIYGINYYAKSICVEKLSKLIVSAS